MTPDEHSGAIFSECRQYRYVLWRIWDEQKPMLMLIGLNPSKASDVDNDNTICKVCKVGRFNNYGGIYMLNLFAWITQYPQDLKRVADPSGHNGDYLNMYASKSKDVVFCWGNFKVAVEKAKQVTSMFNNALCFHHNRNGSPKHPLFCKDKTILIKFNYPV